MARMAREAAFKDENRLGNEITGGMSMTYLLELLTILLENPTNDSVEVAVVFVTVCRAMLQDLFPKALRSVFEHMRGILHEVEIEKRVQFLIEGLFTKKRMNFWVVRPELDLVEEEENHDPMIVLLLD
ncbi:hypothetical protein TIFTF001_040642 [Ficus carica]|uniref:Uncharacterized protein n=1 Tax=Ficus carica TaxID=3494 RepID=A0AA87Z466_FICCA|nr:hypothetical protein TIFTF001_040642 [Ficus carica]